MSQRISNLDRNRIAAHQVILKPLVPELSIDTPAGSGHNAPISPCFALPTAFTQPLGMDAKSVRLPAITHFVLLPYVLNTNRFPLLNFIFAH